MVVSTRTWAEVPAELRPRLAAAAQDITDGIAPQIQNADAEAIKVMKKYGLTITEVPPAAAKEWESIVDKGFSFLIGRSYDRTSFDEARKYLDEFLKTHPRR
jgi:TRAP-type C4-dicarboxylate transport system substrate-binding protein